MPPPARSAARSIAPHVVLRVALLAAVLASAILFVDYANAGDPAFCGTGSGCMAVRRSDFSHVGPVPLPAIGLVAQGTLFILALAVRDAGAALFVAVVAAVAGALGVTLLGIQAFVVQAFCKWCVVVDTSSIVAALAAGFAYKDTKRSGERVLRAASTRRLILAWLVGLAAMIALPFAWGEHPVVPAPPPEIAALAVPGKKLTIVSFTDFQCPYCRRLGPALHDIARASPDRVALVRLMVPLASHRGALPAALAYTCTPDAQRDAMAERLYGLDPDQLTLEGMKQLAANLDLDTAAFARCLAASTTRAKVDRDRALFDKLDLEGLPCTYVGQRAIVGANVTLVQRLAAATLEGSGVGLPVWALLVIAVLLAAGLAALTARAAARAITMGGDPPYPPPQATVTASDPAEETPAKEASG